MEKATLKLDPDYVIAPVDPRIYSNFVEHLGRCVYGGIYEKGHDTADENGFRGDVKSLVRALNIPLIRYPGGNFVSGFDWRDSIGPAEGRPHRLDLAWFTTETNEVGLHEFHRFCQEVGSEVMYAVNLGTGTVEQARNVVEYCNHPGGTYLSDLRRRNGAAAPLGIKTWCLGNEMDGPWQISGKTAHEYGRIANEAAKVMKWVDDSIEVVACGSSGTYMRTFGDWELEVLDQCYDQVDYISLHRYYGNRHGDTQDFLASTLDLEGFIRTVVGVCDAIQGKKRSKKQVHLSFDEWNVWYHSNAQDEEIKKHDRWGKALPLLEDVYTFEDALVVGLMLITFLRHADRVKIACMAQLVNVIAPIMTRNGGGAWAQTIYWPLLQASQMARGISLQPVLKSPLHDTKRFADVPYVDAAATQADDGAVNIFAVNRHLTEPVTLEVDLRAFPGLAGYRHSVLRSDDLQAVNTEAQPDRIRPVDLPGGTLDRGLLVLELPPASWNVLRVSEG